jgi:holo-[acyl-carrier protein] synthase
MAFEQTLVFGSDQLGAGSLRAGVDRVELDEFKRTVAVAGQRFLERVFTPQELAYCAGRIERLADRFAAKEAVVKVLGTGFRGISPTEVEVRTRRDGQPEVALHGRAQLRAQAIGLTSVAISLTNTTKCAEAFAVGLCTQHDQRR